MEEPFVGSEALAAGMTRHQLRTRYMAIHWGVYVTVGTEPTPVLRAKAAWLRSRRRGVLAGFSAAAMHGARWIDSDQPACVIDENHRPERGIVVWRDDVLDDEIWLIDGIRVTNPIRTAIDLACRFPPKVSIPAIDALLRATKRTRADVLAALPRHAGRKGIVRARKAIALVDGAAQSRKETWLRLLFLKAGYPWPEAQCIVYDDFGAEIGHVDGGWRDRKIGYEYQGEHHTDIEQLTYDIRRVDAMREMGWIILQFTCRDGTAAILARLAKAWAAQSGSGVEDRPAM